ncbi:hypothetical protein Leryth_006565, partial [Lithospermum erythrorhizon]
ELVGRYGKSSSKLTRKTSNCSEHSFTPQEEELIIKLHATIGSRWFIIAQQLPGRTDNEVKNIWNIKLRKKLTAMGIDPVTHRPFSQILADYGNIGASQNADKSRFGSLTRTSKTNPNLSQLEAIKMVTAEYMSSHFNSNFSSQPPEAPSSEWPSPSSSSNQDGASSGFNWIDFLLEDESLSGTIQEHDNHGSTSRGNMIMEEEPNNAAGDVCNVQMNDFEATIPSSRSFVEAILENEQDMLSDFHGLADDQFYY